MMTTSNKVAPQPKPPVIDPTKPLSGQPLSIEAELAAALVFQTAVRRGLTSADVERRALTLADLDILNRHEQHLRRRLRCIQSSTPN